MAVIAILRASPAMEGIACEVLAAYFPGFDVVSVVATETGTQITIRLESGGGSCPDCAFESRSVHSTYERKLRDLPILGRPVVVLVQVRRFRCKNPRCPRKTFAESLGLFARPHAQRTERLTMQLLSLVLTTSSRTAAHLAEQMGIQTSPRTLLRTVNRKERSVSAPRVLGIDDFALRRGRTYGTVLCDLESGQPVDILFGRNAETVYDWLKKHPGVEIVARDRATAYAEAVRRAAPNAVQVADRFHLVRNVSEAFQEVVDRRVWVLPERAVAAKHPAHPPAQETARKSKPPTKAQQARQAAAERLRRRYEEVHRRYANGESIRAISRATGLDRKTVAKYVRSSDIPQRAPRPKVRRKIDPYLSHLAERWQSGCRNSRKLYEEIREQGYSGSYSMVRHELARWRAHGGPASGPETGSAGQPYAWKDVRWALLCPPEHRTNKQQQIVEQVLTLNPELDLAHSLLQRFRHMLREHQADELDQWLADAAGSGLSPFARLARTFTADKDAILAAIELPWSTGPVEGIITRIKFMKRLGYGRASLALLRARVLGVR